MSRPRLIALPQVPDRRGNLTFLEGGSHVPFGIKRAYWLHEVPGGVQRDGHAYHRLEEMLIALSGSFDVVVDDGHSSDVHQLNRSYFGLYVPPLIWRRLGNFSTNAVCLVLASRHYERGDYLYSRGEFLAAAGRA